jgi:hypothetical protein
LFDEPLLELFPDEPLTGATRIESRQQLQVLLWIELLVRLTVEQLHPVALSVDVKLTLVALVLVAFLLRQVQFYDPVLLLAVTLTVQLQVALFWQKTGAGTTTGRQHEQFVALTLVCPVVRLTWKVTLLQLQEFLAKS